MTPEESLAHVAKAWPEAFEKHLGSSREIVRQLHPSHEPAPVVVHETDPPETFNARRRGVRRPSGLPVLIGGEVAPKGVPTERNLHYVRVDEHPDAAAWEVCLKGQAMHVVADARRRQAGGVVLGKPALSGEYITLPTTFVMTPVASAKPS